MILLGDKTLMPASGRRAFMKLKQDGAVVVEVYPDEAISFSVTEGDGSIPYARIEWQCSNRDALDYTDPGCELELWVQEAPGEPRQLFVGVIDYVGVNDNLEAGVTAVEIQARHDASRLVDQPLRFDASGSANSVIGLIASNTCYEIDTQLEQEAALSVSLDCVSAYGALRLLGLASLATVRADRERNGRVLIVSNTIMEKEALEAERPVLDESNMLAVRYSKGRPVR